MLFMKKNICVIQKLFVPLPTVMSNNYSAYYFPTSNSLITAEITTLAQK